MPTLADIKRLEALEQTLGVAHGTHGFAVVEIAATGEVPNIEMDDFTGEMVLVRCGDVPEGAFRATVNGRWRAGLPAREYHSAPVDEPTFEPVNRTSDRWLPPVEPLT